ncbi:cyclic nucleotide-binding domain-containing protein [Blastochloris viridis]|uniref:DNA-binding transcriptional dual regulator Crp n=1 Tax=Blastochloris viridis TaxID=1079 RepID=A0A0H5BCU8_BLAVI|nr:cyclic nucleotide-binding domain-containing protein [Blastochloris viridis]ALK11063.1 DNA-binding transcriptional dual regulator Crp [Blastochloris viridis]BAR98949.1 cAMP-binding proteins - catabolite gene activator and regulatory subunit of cAMP-dependent protein kinases [Blastochloris viridis]CUU43725.1 DNA-binding transcriptional dual regulator Crp [Blastochloris viridis]
MALDDDVALLERVAVLQVLGRDALRILAIGAEARRLKAGDTLFREGEDADAAYVVASGTVALKNVLHTDRAEVLAGPGAMIGETALITEVRRPATAVGRNDATLLRIPRHTFLRMLEGYPAAAEQLQALLARRLADTIAELDRVRRRLDVSDRAS